jgi:hypothetical protein
VILKYILRKNWKEQSLNVAVLVFLIFLLGIVQYPSEGGSPSGPKDKLISSVTKLDFDKVGFWLDTEPEYRKVLLSLAIEKLTAAGLYTEPYKGIPSPEERIGLLKLTLRSYPLDEENAGKVLYERRLELWEPVAPVRNPELRIESVTWSYGLSRPIVRDQITLSELEEDLDRYLSEFIRSYRMGNPKQP